MRALAAPKRAAAAKAVTCLLECTQGTQFESYLDEAALKEIANVVSFELQTFSKTKLNQDYMDEEIVSRAQKIIAESKKVCIVENDLKFNEEELEMMYGDKEGEEKK